MANAKAELDIVREYLKLKEEKINDIYNKMMEGNSAIRSKYNTKVSEMKLQLGLREKGEKKYNNTELSDLL